ncbi:MAG: class I SAM-dependent methyltransferase [Proteobacteria bacterium]|nr:class I SAM-dependent methyltransferase [Pseudomonadota bacterium]
MTPSMTAMEINRYCELLNGATNILEFGAGGSTLLAAERPGLQITSVDSDPGWFAKLREKPAINRAEKEGRLRLLHIDIGPTGEWGHPIDDTKRELWPNYSNLPWEMLDQKPDLVFIDGRFRVACGLCTALHAKPGQTVVAVHDFERRRYRALKFYLKKTEMVERLAIFEPRRFMPPFVIENALRKYAADPR